MTAGERVNDHDDRERLHQRAHRVPMNTASSTDDPSSTTPVTDLSESGVFVCTTDRPAIGSTIELRFQVFVEEPVAFRARGRVVRLGDDPPGVGVTFVDLDEAGRDVIRKILLRHEAQRSRPNFAQAFTGLRTHGLVLETVEGTASGH